MIDFLDVPLTECTCEQVWRWMDDFIRCWVLFPWQILTIPSSGAEIELNPLHDAITFVISDEGSGNTVSECSEGRATNSVSRGRAPQRESLQVHDLEITVCPVNSQPPSVSTGKLLAVNVTSSSRHVHTARDSRVSTTVDYFLARWILKAPSPLSMVYLPYLCPFVLPVIRKVWAWNKAK